MEEQLKIFSDNVKALNRCVERWTKLNKINAPKHILNNERVNAFNLMNKIFVPENNEWFKRLNKHGIEVIENFSKLLPSINPISKLESCLELNDSKSIEDEALEIINT